MKLDMFSQSGNWTFLEAESKLASHSTKATRHSPRFGTLFRGADTIYRFELF